MQGLHLERFIEDIGISEEAINNLQQWIKSKEQAVPETLKTLATQYTVHKIQGGNIEWDGGKNSPILDDLLLNSSPHTSNVKSHKIK